MKKHEEYIKEITKLTRIVKNNTALDDIDRETVINDTFIKLLSKMESGEVPSDNYDDYKNYMFVVTKNEVYHQLNQKSRQLNKLPILQEIALSNDYTDKTSKEFEEDFKLKLRLIEELPITEKYLIQERLKGTTVVYLANELKITESKCQRIIEKISIKLKHKYDEITQLEPQINELTNKKLPRKKKKIINMDRKRYYEKNKEKIKAQERERYARRTEEQKAQRNEKHRLWTQKNKARLALEKRIKDRFNDMDSLIPS